MSFTPDFFVSAPDGGSYALVIGVRCGRVSPEALEQLKNYMISMSCPVGLLVTGESIELLRDSYVDFTAAAIQSVGQFGTPARLAAASRSGDGVFERAARDWLEGLRNRSNRATLEPALRSAVEEHLLPLLLGSEVVAARPLGPQVRAS